MDRHEKWATHSQSITIKYNRRAVAGDDNNQQVFLEVLQLKCLKVTSSENSSRQQRQAPLDVDYQCNIWFLKNPCREYDLN